MYFFLFILLTFNIFIAKIRIFTRPMRLVIFFFLIAPLYGICQAPQGNNITDLLCAHTWKMTKLIDITGKGGSMGADLFAVTTQFKPDGSIETWSAGHLTRDTWQYNPEDKTLVTSQINDPKSGQVKETIIEITETKFIVRITYRGNNIMQYEYEAVTE